MYINVTGLLHNGPIFGNYCQPFFTTNQHNQPANFFPMKGSPKTSTVYYSTRVFIS